MKADDYTLHSPYLVEQGPLMPHVAYPGEQPQLVENRDWRGTILEIKAIAWPFAVVDLYAAGHAHPHRFQVDLSQLRLRACPKNYADLLKPPPPKGDPFKGLGKRAPQ